jgi:hypothetical protein
MLTNTDRMPTFTDPANNVICMSSFICRSVTKGKRKRRQREACQHSANASKGRWECKEENINSKHKQEASKASSAMEQSKPNSELEQSQGPVDNNYERFRLKNIACNNERMQELGIRQHGKSGSSSQATGLVAKTPDNKKRGVDDKQDKPLGPAHSSPTRYQTELQKQQILVVLGSELHCSDPRHPESHNVHFPLNSSKEMSAVVYPGTCFEWYCSFLTLMYSPRTLVPGSHKVLVDDGDTSGNTSEFKCQVVRRNSDEMLVTSAGLGISFFFHSRPVQRISFPGPFGPSGKFFKRTLRILFHGSKH